MVHLKLFHTYEMIQILCCANNRPIANYKSIFACLLHSYRDGSKDVYCERHLVCERREYQARVDELHTMP
jgi:hypothetical protein